MRSESIVIIGKENKITEPLYHQDRKFCTIIFLLKVKTPMLVIVLFDELHCLGSLSKVKIFMTRT